MFLLSIACFGSLLIFVGFVDFALASVILLGIIKQNRYALGAYGRCGTIADWKPGEGRNFFVEAFESDDAFGSYESSTAICRSLSSNWKMGIAIV